MVFLCLKTPSKLQGVVTEFQSTIEQDGSITLPDDNVMIVTPNTSQSIRTVTIASSGKYVPLPFLNALLARTPQIKEFHFTDNAAYGHCYFPPQAGRNISDEAKANLTHLETLNVSESNVDPAGLLELLQSSNNYVSLNLSFQALHNGHLREISRNPSLTHLNLHFLANTGEEALDFRVLSQLRNLTHFVAPKRISKDDLIAIIEANPNLQELDLSNCYELEINPVLEEIAEKLHSLRSLKLDSASKVSRFAFMKLIDKCPALTELTIPGISVKRQANLTPEDIAADKMTKEALIDALNILKDRRQLKVLELNNTKLTDDILSIIASIPSLTNLSISFRSYEDSKLTEAGLLHLQQLINLETLDLDGRSSVTESVLAGVANHCPKLRTLYMNRDWWNMVREEGQHYSRFKQRFTKAARQI